MPACVLQNGHHQHGLPDGVKEIFYRVNSGSTTSALTRLPETGSPTQKPNNRSLTFWLDSTLDEFAIAAEAIKSLAPELEMLERMLMSLESRRNRAIRGIAEYRESFAEKVREVSDRVIEGDPVLRLQRPNDQKTA